MNFVTCNTQNSTALMMNEKKLRKQFLLQWHPKQARKFKNKWKQERERLAHHKPQNIG